MLSLSNAHYAVFDTHYTERLVNRIDEINQWIDQYGDGEHDYITPMFIFESNKIVRLGNSNDDEIDDVLDVLENYDMDGGIICFKFLVRCCDIFPFFDISEMLTEMNYCSGMGKIPYEIKVVKTKDNKKIVYFYYDTESG